MYFDILNNNEVLDNNIYLEFSNNNLNIPILTNKTLLANITYKIIRG